VASFTFKYPFEQGAKKLGRANEYDFHFDLF